MGVASFPLDMEGPNFATGALKVNPAYKKQKSIIKSTIINTYFNITHFGTFRNRLLTDEENEAGVEAVALTIGDENVKGPQGGVEVVGGSLEENTKQKHQIWFQHILNHQILGALKR